MTTLEPTAALARPAEHRADRRRIRRGRFLNRLRVVLDRELTAANVVDRAAAAHPDSEVFHLAAPLPYRHLQGDSLTSRQLLGFVDGVGSALQQAGMRRWDRVAICKTNEPDYVFLAMAIIRAGGIAVPINPGMEPAALDAYLRYTGASMLLTDGEWFAERVGDPARLPAVETWVFPAVPTGFSAPAVDLRTALEAATEPVEPVRLDCDSDVMIVHTSGTTGVPKGVISTSGSLMAAIKGHYLEEPVSRRSRSGIAAPYHHLVCQIGLFSSMLGNLPVWTRGELDAEGVLAWIEQQRLQYFFAFPDVFQGMYEAGLERFDLSSIRVWVSGADASHEAQMQAFCRQGALLRLFGRPLIGALFLDCLGSSEIGCAALKRVFSTVSRQRFARLAGRRGPAAPRIKVADEEGRTLPPGRAGRLMVKGPTVFKGYWNSHDRLHGAMCDGWWWTGDIARRDRWGRLYHLDRATDVIDARVGSVFTLPTEEVLLSHPDVAEAVVFGVSHPEEGTVPVALICPFPGRTVDPDRFLAWAALRLPAAARPRAVRMLPSMELPRGLTGKVLKRLLRQRHGSWLLSGDLATTA